MNKDNIIQEEKERKREVLEKSKAIIAGFTYPQSSEEKRYESLQVRCYDWFEAPEWPEFERLTSSCEPGDRLTDV